MRTGKGGDRIPRAKLTYENRLWLEDAFDHQMDPMEICEHLGISTYQLQMEKKLGWIPEKKIYSAEKAQRSLK